MIGTHDGEEYSFAHVCRGRRHQLRLRRSASRDEEGRPSWRHVDTLLVPRLGANEELVFGRWSTCRRGGQPDPAIVAIVVETEKPEYTEIRQARRAELASGRIVKIDTGGLVCVNDSCGL